MRNYITEFIGTFFLMLVIAVTGNPLAIGAVLMVMIFAGGHISGAHYNPAVTLALLVRKKITAPEAGVYMIVQVIGAIAAVFLAKWLIGEREMHPLDFTASEMYPLVAELLGTFALAYVVLNVATARGNAGNSFYGLAIGFTVFAMATTFGSISGGAFNPAVAIGGCVLGAFAWKSLWIYLVACFLGGLVAGLLFVYLNQDDKPVPPIQKEV